jgi:hypothetical protein
MRPQSSDRICLPYRPSIDVQRGQPAAAVAIGINANYVATIEDFSCLLGCVTDDCDLAVCVRRWRAAR